MNRNLWKLALWGVTACALSACGALGPLASGSGPSSPMKVEGLSLIYLARETNEGSTEPARTVLLVIAMGRAIFNHAFSELTLGAGIPVEVHVEEGVIPKGLGNPRMHRLVIKPIYDEVTCVRGNCSHRLIMEMALFAADGRTELWKKIFIEPEPGQSKDLAARYLAFAKRMFDEATKIVRVDSSTGAPIAAKDVLKTPERSSRSVSP